MIISRSPLRISLGGGGTDLPSYFKKGGMESLAINKYVYTTIIKPYKKLSILNTPTRKSKKIDKFAIQLLRNT